MTVARISQNYQGNHLKMQDAISEYSRNHTTVCKQVEIDESYGV